MSVKRILVVDDEASVRRLLRECFESDGYDVQEADGKDAMLRALATTRFDMITLDIRLGGSNGLDLISVIRSEWDVPVVMITGQEDVIDKVVGLEKGADDYITKPFHVREILARSRAILRRARTPEDAQEPAAASSKKLTFSCWTLHPDTFELFAPDGQLFDLTTAEFKLLHVFAQNPKRVLSRDQLMDLIKGSEWSPLDRTIDNQVARLRKKLEDDPTNPQLIKTVRGVGYSFTPEVKIEGDA